jgi:type II secretory ATPase GspE/PulE/Tfp pilus assembly ATPase PilB-like protein
VAEARRGKMPIGEYLVAENLITQGELLEALASRMVVDGRRERLGETLERLGYVGPSDISRMVARQFDLEFVDEVPTPQSDAQELVPEQLARRHGIVPLWIEGDGTLVVLTADPTDVVATDDVRLSAGARRVRPIVAPPERVGEALQLVYLSDGSRTGDLLDQITSEAGPSEDPLDPAGVDPQESGPVIRLAEQIIHDALHGNASDIHVEPGKKTCRVRYRIDGVLHEVMTIPRKVHAPLVSRLKLLASLDIAERRRPQDGRSTYRSRSAEVDIRVSTMPLLHGEKMVLRLLRKGAEQLEVDEIGLSDQQLARVLEHIERPQGLVLLTGPTGAGKTSTLYAFMSHLADEERNLITVEDPVEYELEGVNQTQVLPRIGYTFAAALRTVLRQDPDIVMVGEIRDLETAELAMQASLTGHMVFSTLHTNDAPGAVTRLADIGIPQFLIASSLTMVVAQRLGRRVCPKCAAPHTPTEREVERLHLSAEDAAHGGWVQGTGCTSCGGTGYRGRIAFMEILSVDRHVKSALLSGAEEDAIRRAARAAGLRSLREDGLTKARAGITTLEEVLRTTPVDLFREEEAILEAAALVADAEAAEEEATYSPEVLEYTGPDAVVPQDDAVEDGDFVPLADTELQALLDAPVDPEWLAVPTAPAAPAAPAGLVDGHVVPVQVRGGQLLVAAPAPALAPAARLPRKLGDDIDADEGGTALSRLEALLHEGVRPDGRRR